MCLLLHACGYCEVESGNEGCNCEDIGKFVAGAPLPREHCASTLVSSSPYLLPERLLMLSSSRAILLAWCPECMCKVR